ncbi:pilin [Frateuria edaphi]|uniref:pilin n=1 Tax=Frateuria edaphi TaxID=2898793 RepID=UPI001E5183C2|nr:pilin [Frateuria edaphi]UGB46566.1 pilin [Frateuria edaphi]
MKKNLQKGFTLIELMIVVAIIAILAAIAIPAYQNYVAKSQFSESQTVADGIKTAVAEYWTQKGTCPTIDGNSAGFPKSTASYAGKYVKEADVATGTATKSATCDITVTFKDAGSVSKGIAKGVATFKGSEDGGNFSWACSANIDDKYLPAACQSK